MCFSDLSSCDLIALSSSLAISVSKNLEASEIALLSTFFTSFADNLALIAAKKS